MSSSQIVSNLATFKMNSLTSKRINIYIYIYIIFFINLIIPNNIFAQLGLNLAHPDHKSIYPKIKQYRSAHLKTN